MQQRAKQKLQEQFALMHEAFAALQQPDVPLDKMADSALPMALDADEGDESDEDGGTGFGSPVGAAGVSLQRCINVGQSTHMQPANLCAL